jgi:hypothetical protein
MLHILASITEIVVFLKDFTVDPNLYFSQVKAKLSMCLTKHQAMKKYGGVGV